VTSASSPDSDAPASTSSDARASTNGDAPASTRHRDIVVLKGVRKSFGETEVLRGIDLVCRHGETTCIVGGSRAGKTTLLRLVVPMSERQLTDVRQKFGMVYQYAALLDSINVLDNVGFPLVEHTKLSRAEIRQRVVEKLRILELDESVLAKFPAELSGGMRKRVGLARALMLDPPIVVYDEPTSGLDPVTSRAVDDLIDDTRRRFGVTSLVITHDIASCFRLADQAVLLSKGQIAARGRPQELAHGDNEIAEDFIRMSGIDVDAVLAGRTRR
jgi:phospholipid/cholesterol/gamma-HCH transport system ATP-binding protein